MQHETQPGRSPKHSFHAAIPALAAIAALAWFTQARAAMPNAPMHAATAPAAEPAIKALGVEDWRVVRRAAMQLAPSLRTRPDARAALIEGLVAADESFWPLYQFHVALGQSPPEAAREILAAWRKHPAAGRGLLAAIARMGPAAKGVGDELRQEADKADAPTRAQILVTLAAASCATPEQLDEIARTIAAGGEPGLAALHALSGLAHAQWVSPAIQKALATSLSKDLDYRVPAEMAIAPLGEKASPELLQALVSANDKAIASDDTGPEFLSAGLSLALIDPKARKTALTTLLRLYPDRASRNTVASMLWMLGNAEPSDAFIADLTDLLGAEPAVAASAAFALECLASAADGVGDALLTALASRDDEDVRTAVASALGQRGRPGQIPAMLARRPAQRGSLLDKAIVESAAVLRLEHPSPSPTPRRQTPRCPPGPPRKGDD